jgi:hypothetical protein
LISISDMKGTNYIHILGKWLCQSTLTNLSKSTIKTMLMSTRGEKSMRDHHISLLWQTVHIKQWREKVEIHASSYQVWYFNVFTETVTILNFMIVRSKHLVATYNSLIDTTFHSEHCTGKCYDPKVKTLSCYI